MSHLPITAWMGSPAVRFVLVGGSNTAITGFIALILGLLIPSWLAFTCAFAMGLVYAVLLTGRWVFRFELNAARSLSFIAAYLLIYFCGLAIVFVLGALGAPRWAPAASVLLTAPLSFVAGKTIFRDVSNRDDG